MTDQTNDFLFTVSVNEKQISIDGMLVMAEFALGGMTEPDNAKIIDVMRRCVRPVETASVLSDAEALAIGLRVSMRLQQLGKPLAP